MNKNLKHPNFIIFCPTFKRPNICKTHKYLKEIIYVVSESQAESYDGVHDKIWVVPDSAQGNLSRVRNYILDNSEHENILLLDDDINWLGKWEYNSHKRLEEDEAYEMMEMGFLLAHDLEVKFWGLNCLTDKASYREYTPFGTRQYIGGPFQAHINNPLRYEEVIYLKEDYDMTIQILNKYRKNLRLNMFHYDCNQANLKGGCAEYRNKSREADHNKMLLKKWGSKIIRFDTGNRQVTRKRQVSYDINPIIKIPISGV